MKMLDQSVVKTNSVSVKLSDYEKHQLEMICDGKSVAFTIRKMIREAALEAA